MIDAKGLPGLDAKAGIVTGSAAGTGGEVLLTLSAARVQRLDIDGAEEGGRQAAHEVAQPRDAAVYQWGDISREDDIVAAIERCRSESGRFNVIKRNAAIAIKKDLEVASADFFGCRQATTTMRGTRGTVVSRSSIASVVGDRILPVYALTEHAILGVTRAIAAESAMDNIRSNCAWPGDILTSHVAAHFRPQS